jgi:glycine/D-amino acid oxidase-like deaminating enzyme
MNAYCERDVIVVGGGLVGAAVAYGLARGGLGVTVVDEGDVAFRAARANFGLVWVQGKGDGVPEYVRWTRRSAEAWTDFARELGETTGIDVAYARPGGVHPCFGEGEMEERRRLIGRLRAQAGPEGYACEMLDHGELAKLVPGLGQRVAGGSYSPYDGHANPLRLLRALHAGIRAHDARYLPGRRIAGIGRDGDSFVVAVGGERLSAAKVVLAAGLGNRELAQGLGLDVPVGPQRGQILATERAERFLQLPILTIRQTDEGTVLLGDSHEDAGLDAGATPTVMGEIAARAVAVLPGLARLRVVRAWAGLRVLSPDGYPVYDRSPAFPGAFVANCHSGVTLAAAHATELAAWIAGGGKPRDIERFSAGRFHVPA